ncbi:MAG: VOC family protein [Microbacteriaceae bacterium]|nr:VOC family protein [Microbacteriaceae bacterium]MCL2796122.1 VOC family protein [Microbacteriaceae bacterium]
MAITHLQVVSIPVSDQDRSLAFYRDVLGFTVLADQQFTPEMRWVMLTPPGARTAITLVDWFPSMPAGSLKGTVLETDDLDADAAALGAKGVDVSPVQSAPWGRFVTFDDPDGNGIVLQASMPGAPDVDVSGWGGTA